MDETVTLAALSASRKDQLQRIKDVGLVEQGRVFLLSLEPIRAQIGVRWPTRSESVWESVERALIKSLPPPDSFVRLSDTTVLVAIASTDSYEGQLRCVAVLRNLLAFFLGRAVDADVALSRISGIDGDSVRADPIDIHTPAPPPTGPPLHTRPAARPENWVPPLTERRASGVLPLTYYGDVGYRIEIVPVWRLDQETIAAYALRFRLPEPVDRLSDEDHEAIGHLTLSHLLPILEEYRCRGGTFILIVPFGFAVLSARRPRMALLSRCAAVKDIMRRAVMAEIADLNPGIPPGLIRETVAMIRPFFKVVTGQVQTTHDINALYREAAFHGVSVRWRTGAYTAIEQVLRAARRRSPNIIVHDVPTRVAAENLKLWQASHVSWAEERSGPT